MNIWNDFKALLLDPIVQNFIISCGASISWDTIKTLIKKKVNKESYEANIYHVLKETFESFYENYNLQFDEEIVMTAFFKLAEHINDIDKLTVEKLISDTTNINVNDKVIEEWLDIFIIVCSKPKYQWVFNKLSLSNQLRGKVSKNISRIDKFMTENSCKIQCENLYDLSKIFKVIDTNLSSSCWYSIQVLIMEILYNAQEHGKSKKCKLFIEKNKISILDEGTKFNPLELVNQKNKKGGAITIKKFLEDYPSIDIESKYIKETNYFIFYFHDNVFNVNNMSEIIIPFALRISHFKLKYPNVVFENYFIDIDEIDDL